MAKYDEFWAAYLEKTHQNVIDTLEQNIDKKCNIKLLDLSAGTGILHKKLAKSDLSFSTIIFNDPDTSMLSNSKKEEIRQTFDCKIGFSHKTIEEYEDDQTSYDAVLSISAYHLYSDKDQALTNIHSLLADNGLAIVLDWNNESWFKPLHWIIKQSDDKPVQAESITQVEQRVAKTGLQPRLCKRWRWYWWNLYTIVLENNYVQEQKTGKT